MGDVGRASGERDAASQPQGDARRPAGAEARCDAGRGRRGRLRLRGSRRQALGGRHSLDGGLAKLGVNLASLVAQACEVLECPSVARELLSLADMTNTEIQSLATRFLPRVRKIARGVCQKLPAHISADDLTQAGIVGMMSALRSFDQQRGDSVEVYVLRRIRGAILDELRALDPLSRDQRRDARAIQNATRQLEGELGRAPGEEEVARRSGIGVDRVRTVRGLASAVVPVSIDDGLDLQDGRTVDPIERLAADEVREALASAVASLGKREQTILSLYYVEELSLKEIGNLLGITESRVCQIHGAAVKKLRVAMSA
jgi:RNA polymerase sigma factor FliA